jgi:MSHA pilin protein MshD
MNPRCPLIFRCVRSGGFTLVEATFSLVIVAIMMSAALATLGTAARSRNNQQETLRGITLARRLMSEIVSKSYQQANFVTATLGPELGETRATFNDVDDYAGYSDSPPVDSSGSAIAGYTGWTRSVEVKWVDASTLLPVTVQAETGVKRITVTATAPSGRSWSVSAIRTASSVYDKGGTVTYPSTATVTIQIGSNSATSATSRINLVNQVP